MSQNSALADVPLVTRAIRLLDGPPGAAAVLKVSRFMAWKWARTGQLPKSDHSGDTDYAARLAAAIDGTYTEEQLLASSFEQRKKARKEATKRRRSRHTATTNV